MAVQLSLDNPAFTLKDKIQELNNNFFSTFGFNYFQYLRCYADGSIGLLTNHTGLVEYLQHIDDSPVIFSSFEDEHESAHSYWFLWDEALPEFPVGLAREKFNIRNGITFVRRSKSYYDMIAVGLAVEQENAGSFYLNKLKIIEQHINDFDKQNRDLIQLMNENRILLPKPYRDVNYEDLCLVNGQVSIHGKKGPTYITSQELSCIRLLLQGYSYKEIAHLLGLSPRTVETYMARIKQRTGFASRYEIGRVLSLCP